MSGALVPYNISLPAASGPWTYTPFRDGPAATGWNASYTGNETWPYWQTSESSGAGNFFFRTQFDTAKIGLEFTGVGLVLCVTGNGATYTLSVDGQIVRTTGARDDPACADYGSTSTLVASELDFGSHTAEVNVIRASDEDFMFYGGVVSTSVAVGSSSETVVERMIDDSAPEWVMVPGRGRQQWDVSVHSNNYQTTTSFMCFYRPNATASYTFRGASAIVMYGGLYRDTHDYAVLLDDKTVNLDASVSGWGVGMTPIFFESNLDPNAQHTITLRNYNEDNPDCSGPSIRDFRSCCVSLDALKLIGSETSLSASVTPSTTPTPAPTSTSTTQSPQSDVSSVQQQPLPSQQQKSTSNSTSAGAIAGGVLGGILGALVIAVAAFFILRYRRRNQRYSYAEPTRQFDLHGGAGSIVSSSVRPYIPPPASSAYSSSSAAGNSYTAASDRKGGVFPAGAAPVGYAPSAAAGPSNAHPPHPSSGKGHRPIPPVPVSYTSSTSTGSGRDAVPLQPEDMNRVLQYVSEQMSQRGGPGGSTAADTLPSYQR